MMRKWTLLLSPKADEGGYPPANNETPPKAVETPAAATEGEKAPIPRNAMAGLAETLLGDTNTDEVTSEAKAIITERRAKKAERKAAEEKKEEAKPADKPEDKKTETPTAEPVKPAEVKPVDPPAPADKKSGKTYKVAPKAGAHLSPEDQEKLIQNTVKTAVEAGVNAGRRAAAPAPVPPPAPVKAEIQFEPEEQRELRALEILEQVDPEGYPQGTAKKVAGVLKTIIERKLAADSDEAVKLWDSVGIDLDAFKERDKKMALRFEPLAQKNAELERTVSDIDSRIAPIEEQRTVQEVVQQAVPVALKAVADTAADLGDEAKALFGEKGEWNHEQAKKLAEADPDKAGVIFDTFNRTRNFVTAAKAASALMDRAAQYQVAKKAVPAWLSKRIADSELVNFGRSIPARIQSNPEIATDSQGRTFAPYEVWENLPPEQQSKHWTTISEHLIARGRELLVADAKAALAQKPVDDDAAFQAMCKKRGIDPTTLKPSAAPAAAVKPVEKEEEIDEKPRSPSAVAPAAQSKTTEKPSSENGLKGILGF